MSGGKEPGAELNGASHSVERFVGRVPAIGDTIARGDCAMKIVDISETRVWMDKTVRGEHLEYYWIAREKYSDVVQKTMARDGTIFTPANVRDHRCLPDGAAGAQEDDR
jgi:hypothetical protein